MERVIQPINPIILVLTFVGLSGLAGFMFHRRWSNFWTASLVATLIVSGLWISGFYVLVLTTVSQDVGPPPSEQIFICLFVAWISATVGCIGQTIFGRVRPNSSSIDEQLVTRHKWRTAAVSAVVIGVLGWLGFRIQTLRSEAQIAVSIEEIGGDAFFGDEIDGGQRLLLFSRLNAVAYYARSSVTDDDITILHELSALEKLFFGHVPITDKGLVHIGSLTNLKSLQLTATLITDAGLVHLRSLKNLTYLDLKDNNVSEAAIKSLQLELPNCKIEH